MSTGGLCITFDDKSVADWVAVAPMLAKYEARATFYISQFHTFTSKELNQLRVLEAYGHEIGYHTVNHPRLENYLEQFDLKHYIVNEIERGLEMMSKLGFKTESFAYPFNNATQDSIQLLSSYFKTQRISSESIEGALTEKTGNYLLRGKSIDLHADSTTFRSRTADDVVAEIKIAAERDKVAVVYAHRVTHELTNQTKITPMGLEYVIHHAKALNLNFYTASELA